MTELTKGKVMTELTGKVSLGTGVLTWQRAERVSDRYGSIYLMPDGQTSLTSYDSSDVLLNKELALQLDGTHGKLWVKVLDPRRSTHIGDMFRGIGPETPQKGDEIDLGDGEFFVEKLYFTEEGIQIGVLPYDDRESDWMDPVQLYRSHEQLVEVFFTVG